MTMMIIVVSLLFDKHEKLKDSLEIRYTKVNVFFCLTKVYNKTFCAHIPKKISILVQNLTDINEKNLIRNSCLISTYIRTEIRSLF